MRKTLVTIITGVVGALAAAGVATMAPSPALATSPSVAVVEKTIDTLCSSLPAAKTAVVADRDKATQSLATANATLTTRRTAMTSTISTFGTSIVNFLRAVDAGGNTKAAGDVLRGHQIQFVDAVVAWSGARTAVYDVDRDLTFAQLRSSFLDSAQTAGCPAV